MMDWEAAAREVILDILDVEYSVTPRELEARASNEPWSTLGYTVDPDFLSAARRDLAEERLLGSAVRATRGGRSIETWHRLDQKRRTTRIENAAARKRLLTTRHWSWAQSSARYPKGLIGAAGENALVGVVTDSDLFSGIRRDATTALGRTLDGGSVDVLCYLTTEVKGRPKVFTTLIEVKNRRQWYYPSHPDLHRFLYKAAQLQAAEPNEPILPVFASARRHHFTLRLGRLLGLYAVQYQAQFVLDRSEVDHGHFAQVTRDLGYSDLILGDSPNNKMRRAIAESLPRNAATTSERWRLVAPHTADLHRQIRDSTDLEERNALTIEVERIAIEVAGQPPDYEPLPVGRV